MHPHPSQHSHEELSQIISGSFAMFSDHLKEAFRRRLELPHEEQLELQALVRAHDQFISMVNAHRAMRHTGFNIHSTCEGSA